MRIAVLALQGDFIEHEQKLSECGVDTFEIRQLADIERDFDGLILPGGESTAIGKLLRELGLYAPLKQKIENGLPVLATCAGMILLAEKIANDDKTHFGTMAITVKRNAYGRQLGSFRTLAEMKGLGVIPMTFIRAPYIEQTNGAEILATVQGRSVAARQGNQLALAFHPELDDSNDIFNYFIDICKAYKSTTK